MFFTIAAPVVAQAQDVFNFSGQTAGQDVDGLSIQADNNAARYLTLHGANFQFASNAQSAPDTTNPANFGNNLPADPNRVIFHNGTSNSAGGDVLNIVVNTPINSFLADFSILDYTTNVPPFSNYNLLTVTANSNGAAVATLNFSGTKTIEGYNGPGNTDPFYAYEGTIDVSSGVTFDSISIAGLPPSGTDFQQFAIGNLRLSPAAVPEWSSSSSMAALCSLVTGVATWKRVRRRNRKSAA